MATLKDVIESARTFLNDDSAITWSDATLIPKAREAHRELLCKLQASDIPITKETSVAIVVAAGAVNLGVNQPTDMVIPIELFERLSGSSELYSSMTPLRTVPTSATQSTRLIYWMWAGGTIEFIGATSDREVKIKYKKSITAPTKMTESYDFVQAEMYIGPRTASLALLGKDKELANSIKSIADSAFADIIQMNIVGAQNLPSRRRGYRRRRKSRYS